MEIKTNILKHFFDKPTTGFGIRELSRLSNINHTSVRNYLFDLITDDIIILKESKPYPLYYANIKSHKFINLKLFYNLEKLRKSELIKNLELTFEYPVIILFGSYLNATDNKDSDIDICIITNSKYKFNINKYENIIERKISLHIFNKMEWKETIKNNTYLANNIINGLVLSGQLEVFG